MRLLMSGERRLKGIFDEKAGALPNDKNCWLQGLNGSALSFVLESVSRSTNGPLLVVANDKEKAAYVLNDLQVLLQNKKALFFPETYRQPYQVEKTTNANIQERAEALNLLSSGHFTGVVVTYPQALAEKVTKKQLLASNTLQVKKGEKLSVDFLGEFLLNYKFEKVDFVYEPGQFSIRGGIIDIYSFAHELPYRIELFGNDIDAIRSFDPATQLSNGNFEFVTVIPNINSQLFQEEKVLLSEYFDPAISLVCIEDVSYCADIFDKNLGQAVKAYEAHDSGIRQMAPERMFSSATELHAEISRFRCMEFGVTSTVSQQRIVFSQHPQPSFQKNFDLLVNHLKQNRAQGYKNYFLTDNARQADRLISIFNDLLAKEHRTYDSLIEYVPMNVHEGFVDDELKIAVYTDHQIFERYHRFRLREVKTRSAEAFTIKELLLLNPGDYVTHIDHGIGRFAGLQKLTINGKEQESVKLLFKDNDALYVSIHSLHRISKYSGKEGQVPRIDKLGSTTWQTLKQKTKKNVKTLAYDLIRLYAE